MDYIVLQEAFTMAILLCRKLYNGYTALQEVYAIPIPVMYIDPFHYFSSCLMNKDTKTNL